MPADEQAIQGRVMAGLLPSVLYRHHPDLFLFVARERLGELGCGAPLPPLRLEAGHDVNLA